MTQPLTPHRAIAGRVKQLRKGRGWSAQRLAEEMAKVGIPWDRSIVANLENGRRAGVSVEELFALAYVLSVAPVHLVVPPLGVDDPTPYRVVPVGPETEPAHARLWIRGKSVVGDVDPKRYFSEVPDSEWTHPGAVGQTPFHGLVKSPTWKPPEDDDGDR